jgi:ubiquinone/menaquinone biosynthesis C-methylase UbiE
MLDNFKHKAADWDTPTKVLMSEKFVETMSKHINFSNSSKVMDFGCGTGLVGLQIVERVNSIIMLDSSKSMTDKLKEKLSVSLQNAEETPNNVTVITGSIEKYNNCDLDVIFSLMALHHIEDIQATMEQFSKIIKPGGVLVIGDLMEEDGSFHGEELVPHNGFNIEMLAKQIENSGLDIVITYPYNSLQKGEKKYEQFIIVATKIKTKQII